MSSIRNVTTQTLKREMTSFQLLFMSFTAIFGSGWLFAPMYAAQIAGPAALVAWLVGALMSIIIGISVAEVVALYPKAGGLNQIAKLTHGDFLSICVTILNLLVFIILPALEVRAILQYLSSYTGYLMVGEDISLLGYIFAMVLLALITLVNIFGARTTANLNGMMVAFKVVTPLMLIGAFLYALYTTGGLDHSRLFEGTPSLSSIPWKQVFQAIATSGIIFSFNGFTQATLFAGEAKDPQKAIPFAIFGSLVLTCLLYLLLQYVFLMAIPQSSLLNGWANLSFAGDQGPFAGIATILGLGWIVSVVYSDAIFSPLGTAFSYASAAPRLLFLLAESSEKLSPLLRLNRFGISTPMIILCFVAEAFAFFMLPNLKSMIAILVAAFVLCYTVAPASLLVLRKQKIDVQRPFQIKAAPVVCFFSMLFSNLMVFSCGWVALRNLLVLTLILVILQVMLSGKSVMTSFKSSLWFFLELAGLVLLCYANHISPLDFQWVVVAVSVLSGLVLWMSGRKF